MTDKIPQPTEFADKSTVITKIWQHLKNFFQSARFNKAGPVRDLSLILLLGLIFLTLLSFWWSWEPGLFNIQTEAQKRAERRKEQMVIGYLTTYTLIQVASTLYNKSGGYLSNDILPPSVFMDDMPNWELGVLQQVRAFAKALRSDISRSPTGAMEDPNLAKMEAKFNSNNQSWFWPSSEGEYSDGVEYLENYLQRLADSKNTNTAQFLARADNLRDWLEDVTSHLGELSQRLSASVGQMRAQLPTTNDDNQQSVEVKEKTPWLQIDDIFYQARGHCWALIHLFRAVEIDFNDVLHKRNAGLILQQVIRELEATQKTVWSPLILNGSEFGIFANHSLVLSSYISRANTGIIELYNLL